MNSSFKPIYILPNLFTAGSIFVGLLSILSAIDGHYEKAAWFIFICLILDGLDGKVARWTNTTSKFGVEFDSLADVIAFGIAPALLLFLFIGQDFGRLGVVVSALFVILGAIRLARFNVSASDEQPGVFIGLPIPTAAVFVAIGVLLFSKYNFIHSFEVTLLLMSLFISFLMVSNFRFPSFKKSALPKKFVYKFLVVVTILLGVIYIFPIESFAILIMGYISYGFFRGIYTIVLIKKEKI